MFYVRRVSCATAGISRGPGGPILKITERRRELFFFWCVFYLFYSCHWFLCSPISSIMFTLLFICFTIMIVFYLFIIASTMLNVKIRFPFIYFSCNASVCCCFTIVCTRYYAVLVIDLNIVYFHYICKWQLFLILLLLAFFFLFFTSSFPTENGYGEFTAAIFSCEVCNVTVRFFLNNNVSKRIHLQARNTIPGPIEACRASSACFNRA